MASIWSDEGKLRTWLAVELAATAAWAELGVVPAEAAQLLQERAVPPAPERVAELEATLHHDTAAFSGDIFGKADKVNGVAQTLFKSYEDCAAFQCTADHAHVFIHFCCTTVTGAEQAVVAAHQHVFRRIDQLEAA